MTSTKILRVPKNTTEKGRKSEWKIILKEGTNHGLINYTDTKSKCRHLKKLHVKGLCGRCLSVFYRRDIQSVMFLLCELLPL